jgi:hypothetical protein
MHLYFEMIWIELKLETKNSLLARVWYSIELIPWSIAYYESVVYDHVDGSALLSFSCSSLACGSFFLFAKMPKYCDCCGKFVWPSDNLRTGKSDGSPSFEEMSRTSHLRAWCGPLYHRYVLNSEHFIIYALLCNSRTHVITFYFRSCMWCIIRQCFGVDNS